MRDIRASRFLEWSVATHGAWELLLARNRAWRWCSPAFLVGGLWAEARGGELAAGAGETKIVDLLISRGADVNHQNAYGNSALHQASKQHHLTVCQSLIKAGAKVDLKNNKGSTPLLLACLNDEISNLNKNAMMIFFKFLVDSGANVNEVDKNAATPLHAAASSGNSNLIEFLLECKANPKAKDSGGMTPLKAAEFHQHKLPATIATKLV